MKKALSIVLAFVVIFSVLSVWTSAVEIDYNNEFTENGFVYVLDNFGDAYIRRYEGNAEHIVIPMKRQGTVLCLDKRADIWYNFQG